MKQPDRQIASRISTLLLAFFFTMRTVVHFLCGHPPTPFCASIDLMFSCLDGAVWGASVDSLLMIGHFFLACLRPCYGLMTQEVSRFYVGLNPSPHHLVGALHHLLSANHWFPLTLIVDDSPYAQKIRRVIQSVDSFTNQTLAGFDTKVPSYVMSFFKCTLIRSNDWNQCH
jgi:hypothetical protein